MKEFTKTICAIATPPGEGGIAVIRMSGPQAYPIAARVFRPINPDKKVEQAKGYTALFGHYLLEGRPMDQTVALFYRAPHSYTGEDVVELSVHGGSAMAQGLMEALLTAGAFPAGAGEFTRRALENGKMDLAQAESVMEVISAAGRQGAALAGAALEGSLSRKIDEITGVLLALRGHLAAWVDYPEEDVPELEEETLIHTLKTQKGELDRLIRDYQGGAILRQGVDAVIVGRPNVGKSTLLNLLAGYDRAIVTPIAGTTRDLVEEKVMLGNSGIRLNLFDTAGIHETQDLVEAEGIRRSYLKLEQAGLILAVFDLSRELTGEDLELARRCQGRPAIAIFNKEDLDPRLDTEVLGQYFKAALPVSFHQEGALELVTDLIRRVLGLTQIDPYAAALTSRRQLESALRAKEALEEGMNAAALGLDAVSVCLDDALEALYDLKGENPTADVIEEVFSKFCVGK